MPFAKQTTVIFKTLYKVVLAVTVNDKHDIKMSMWCQTSQTLNNSNTNEK